MRAFVALCTLFSLNLYAATVGSGTAETENRPVSDFNQIELEGTGTLILTPAAQTALTIRADDNVLGELASAVDDKTLTIKPLSDIKPKTPIEYRVSVKKLKEVEIAGAAEVMSTAPLVVDELTLKIEGAAKGDLTVRGKRLEVEIDGAGNVTISGQVEEQDVEIDGAGKYRAFELKSKEATIEINGAGKAEVYVTDKLEVESNGAGSVTYKGNPKVTQKIRGIGSVRQA